MKIFLNGQSRDVPEAVSVATMLEQLELRGKHVAVEVNAELVPKRRHGDHRLTEGDTVEVVTLVGGG